MCASIKYDGFRATLLNGVFHSPEMKPFSNKLLPEVFAEIGVIAQKFDIILDGELWHPLLTFDKLSSNLRAHQGDLTGVEYHIFDVLSVKEWNEEKTTRFINRYIRLQAFAITFPTNCRVVQQFNCLNSDEAATRYSSFLGAGCEGMILRSPSSPYKNNRCTHLESNCLKFKHFETADAKIVEVLQRRRMKDIERTYNPLGLLEKVHTQNSFDLDDAVGAFQVLLEDGKVTSINLGRGFSYMDRRKMWLNRDDLIGKTVEFKWMPHGTKDLPRIGSVVRFRPDKD